MSLKFYAPLWGNTLPLETFCRNIKTAGYDGVELDVPFEEEKRKELVAILNDHELEMIAQYWQSSEKDWDTHARNFEAHLRNMITVNPVLINCQTGKDYYSFEQNKRLIELAAKISAYSGINIIHETHRNKCLYAAHVTQMYLSRIPDLRICLDISHWCNVHESLLEDQQEAVELAITRTDHIHSRVGHPEGPQVNDPRAPEWKPVLDAHLAWWDRIVEIQKKKGIVTTITTEFGPALYMPTVPFTQMPLANQWEINVYMLGLLKTRYQSR
jgi:sugar phosphate isomerase/epimerase